MMKIPRHGKKSLALLAALMLTLQVGLVPALAKAAAPLSGAAVPKARILGDPSATLPIYKDATAEYYVVNLYREADANLNLNQTVGLVNTIYLVVNSQVEPPLPLNTPYITGFRPGVDKIVVVDSTPGTVTWKQDGGWFVWYKSSVEAIDEVIADVGVLSTAPFSIDLQTPGALAGGYITIQDTGATYTLTANPIRVGMDALTYQWYKGTQPIGGPTGTATLTIPKAEVISGDEYFCEIAKGAQKVTTPKVKLPACSLQAAVLDGVLTAAALTAQDLALTGDSGTLDASVEIPLSGACDLAAHSGANHLHDYQLTWKFEKEEGPTLYNAPATNLKIEGGKIKSAAEVALSQAAFGPSGKVTVTATLAKDGTPVGSAQKQVMVTVPQAAACNAAITGGTFTGPDAIDLTTGTYAYTYTFDPVYTGECNIEGHAAIGHEKSDFFLATDEGGTAQAAFVTLGKSANQVTLTFNEIPQPTTVLYLFGKDTNGIISGTKKTITVTGCNQVYNSDLAFSAATQDVKITGDSQEINLTPPTGTLDGVCKVTNHDHGVFQYSYDAPAKLVKSFDAATGQLVLHRSEVPYTTNPAKGTVITVTATPLGKESPKAILTLRVYQDPTCDRALTGVTGPQTVDLGRSSAAAKEYAAQFGGSCNTPGHDHAVTWKLKSTSGGAAPAGVTVDAKGKVTFSRAGLAQQTTQFLVEATSNGVSKSLEVTVTKVLSSNTDSGSDTRQQYDREWEDLNYDIEDARTGQRITQKLGSNTNMPFTVWDTIRGRNVTLELSFSGGYTWTVNGSTVKKLPDGYIYIPLEVKEIRHEKIQSLARDNDVVILDLQHSGSFFADMRLNYPVGSSYAGKTLYLYKYLEDSGKLSYRTSAKVDANGVVTFPFASASTYLVSAKALYGETAASGGGGTVGSGGSSGTLPPQLPSSSVPPAPPAESKPEASQPTPPSSVSSQPEVSQPTQQEPEPAQRDFPLVPVLLVAIAAVILAIILVARRGGKSYQV